MITSLILLTIAGMRPMIEVYSNRVEFSNPGDPVVPIDRFIDAYRSRNERLADIMRRLISMENKLFSRKGAKAQRKP